MVQGERQIFIHYKISLSKRMTELDKLFMDISVEQVRDVLFIISCTYQKKLTTEFKDILAQLKYLNFYLYLRKVVSIVGEKLLG